MDAEDRKTGEPLVASKVELGACAIGVLVFSSAARSNSSRRFCTYVDGPAHCCALTRVVSARRRAYQQGRALAVDGSAQGCEARRRKWSARFRTYGDEQAGDDK